MYIQPTVDCLHGRLEPGPREPVMEFPDGKGKILSFDGDWKQRLKFADGVYTVKGLWSASRTPRRS